VKSLSEASFSLMGWDEVKNRVGLWNAECWQQVNQHQHVFAGKSLCAKTFKSCGDSSTRDQPEPSTTLYIVERELACMLCMFVLPPTSLIKVVNSGSFHWALPVFIYFRFMLAFRVQFAGDVNQKISFATTALSNTFSRSLLGLIHWSPSCPLQLSIFSI